MKFNISILWWTSWFWKWLAEYIITNFKEYVDVTITWVNVEKWQDIASQIGVKFLNNNIEAAKTADILIFSVPISKTLETIKDVIPFARPWTIVSDVTSVKSLPAEYLYKYAPEWVLVIPTHPMFWPYVKTIASQIFVLTPDEKTSKDDRYEWLKNYLKSAWANVYETSPLEHDKMMAVIQWLTHFNLFTFWETMKRLEFDIGFSQNFVSPIYKILTASVARYVSQNPWLYADIQMNNPEIMNVHNTFINVAKDFNTWVKDKDTDKFVWTIEKCHNYFDWWAEEWQKYTDKIIYLMSMQVNKINKYLWDTAIFENIYTKAVIEWKITKFENNIIFLDSDKMLDVNEWIIL